MQPRNVIDSHLIIYQNPVLLASIIHSFLKNYTKGQGQCDIILLYYIVPMLLINDYCQILNGTQLRSGLDKFLLKFTDQKSRDLLFRLKYDAQRCFKLTSAAIFTGHACNLFSVDSSKASIAPLSSSRQPKIPPALIRKVNCAKKLGEWLSEYSGIEAVAILRQGEE